MNGFETLEWNRRKPSFQSLPVIVLSSSNLAEDVERARELGATEYLVKPGSLVELEKLIASLADRLATMGQPGS
jgi:CheY-like chemotaxis protein